MIIERIFCISLFLFISACGGNSGNTISENEPPIAVITADKPSVKEGDIVSFSASNSSDPENDILTYQWKFESTQGVKETNVSETFISAPEVNIEGGTFDAILTVTDTKNNTSTSKLTIDIENIEVNSNTISLQEKCSSLDIDALPFYKNSGSRVSSTNSLSCYFDSPSAILSLAESEEIKKFHNLVHLSFTNPDPNNIIFLDTITDLSSLKNLYSLSLNNVNIVDNSIGLIKQLKNISLAGGKITPEIYNLINLDSLSLRNFSLNTPLNLMNLDELESLSLSNIDISSSLQSPLSLTNLDKLKSLSLMKVNNLNSIEFPESLAFLELSGLVNPVINSSIQNQTNLKSLSFEKTNLLNSFDFSNLVNLEYLFINEPISTLDLTGLSMITILRLKEGMFEQFPDISSLVNLEVLEVINNKLILEKITIPSSHTKLHYLNLETRLNEFPDISKIENFTKGKFLYFKTLNILPLLETPIITPINIPPTITINTLCNDDVKTRFDIPFWVNIEAQSGSSVAECL